MMSSVSRFMARASLAALSGAVIAFMGTGLMLYAADYGLDELPPSMLGMILGGGAVLGVAAALVVGRYTLPEWVRPAALGSLAGVAAVVVVSYVLDIGSGGLWSKAHAYRSIGLVFGVPVGLIAGAAAGLAMAQRHATPLPEAESSKRGSLPPAEVRDHGDAAPARS
jgi:hypothetical protein